MPTPDQSLVERLERAAERLEHAPEAQCYDDDIAELRRRIAEHDARDAAHDAALAALAKENTRHASALDEIAKASLIKITEENAVAKVKAPIKDVVWKAIGALVAAGALAAAAALGRLFGGGK